MIDGHSSDQDRLSAMRTRSNMEPVIQSDNSKQADAGLSQLTVDGFAHC